MKYLIVIPIIMAVLVSSCIKQKEKKDQDVSTITNYTLDTSNVTYTATFVKGNVAWSTDESSWNRVETKKNLLYGCFIETGKKSATTLMGSIGDVVQMSEQAKVQLTIEELKKRGERSSLVLRGIRMINGKAKFNVKTGGRFTVETPTAKVEVKGTVFVVDVDSTGKTDVAVIEGVVDVIPRKDTSHVNTLLPGKVLRSAGNIESMIDSCTTKDTSMISGESAIVPDTQLSTEKGSTNLGISNPTPALNDQEAKKRLTPTPGYHGKKTQQEGLAASERISQEKQATLQKIEAEKATYEAKKDSIENAHAAMKAAEEKKPEIAREEAQEKLDNERAVSENRFDDERAKVEAKFAEEKNVGNDKTDAVRKSTEKRLLKERSSIKKPQGNLGGASGTDDPFEELQRRRGE